MKKLRRHKGIIIFLLIFFFTGAIGLNIQITKPYFSSLIPWGLIMSYLILLAYHRSDLRIRTIIGFMLVALGGFLVEMAGVMSGQIFGEYTYGDTLGWQLFDVPFLIGLNWTMLAYCAHLILNKYRLPAFLSVFLGALIMTAYDFMMEPVAVALDMWQWKDGIIPLQNYLAWFILSAIFLSFLRVLKLRYRNVIAIPLFFIQSGFFGVQFLFLYLRSLFS